MIKYPEKTLFICSTYYHVLISIVKILLAKGKKADIILSDYIDGSSELKKRIEKTGIFSKVFLVEKRIEEYQPPTRASRILWLHHRNKIKIEAQFHINLKEYTNINIFHDGTWFAHYLQNNKIKYTLIEDSLNSFKLIKKSVFSELIQKNGIVNFFKNLFHIGYCYLGLSKYNKEIEVNDDNEIFVNNTKKVRIEPRDKMFQKLTTEDIKIIKQIFPIKDSFSPNERYSILITQPLFEDRYVDSYQKQEEIYKKAADEYFLKNEIFYIKPHPRDKADYSNIFPNAIVLERNIPLEIYNFHNVSFNLAISLFSTAGGSIINAKNSKMIINIKNEMTIKENLENRFFRRENVL